MKGDLQNRLALLQALSVVNLERAGSHPNPIFDEPINCVRTLIGRPDRVQRETYTRKRELNRVAARLFIGMDGTALRVGSSTRVVVSMEAVAQSVCGNIKPEFLEAFGKLGRQVISTYLPVDLSSRGRLPGRSDLMPELQLHPR